MSRKYVTRSWATNRIEVVEIIRETDSSVWIKNGSCEVIQRKDSGGHKFHDTWLDARAHLMQRALDKLNAAEAEAARWLQQQVEAGNIPLEEPA